jgi:hypothetical protein
MRYKIFLTCNRKTKTDTIFFYIDFLDLQDESLLSDACSYFLNSNSFHKESDITPNIIRIFKHKKLMYEL